MRIDCSYGRWDFEIQARSVWNADHCLQIDCKSQAEAARFYSTGQIDSIVRAFETGDRAKKGYCDDIAKSWTLEEVHKLDLPRRSEHFLYHVKRVSKKVGCTQAVELVERVACERIRRQPAGRGGRGCAIDVLTVDWETVAAAVRKDRLEDVKAFNILSRAELQARLLPDIPRMVPITPINPSSSNKDDNNPATKKRNRRLGLRAQAKKARKVKRPAKKVTRGREDDADTETNEGNGSQQPSDAENQDDVEMIAPNPQLVYLAILRSVCISNKFFREHDCGCPISVDGGLLDRVDRSSSLAAGLATDQDKIILIQRLDSGNDGLQGLCIHHVKRLAKHCGLEVGNTETEGDIIKPRLMVLAKQRSGLRNIRQEHVEWFKHRKVKTRALWAYKPTSPVLGLAPLGETLTNTILLELSGGDASYSCQQWEEHGVLEFKLFDWVYDGLTARDGTFIPGIGDLIDEEFRMWQYHESKDGKADPGHMASMAYSLTAQMFCHDISHWLLYSALRSDGKYQMIAYPGFPEHHVTQDDRLATRTVDVPISKFVASGWGGYAVQGHVSLDSVPAQSRGVAMEVVRGGHQKLNQWWEDVIERGEKVREGPRRQDVSDLWLPLDEAKFGAFERLTSVRGHVLVRKAATPHGKSTGAESSAPVKMARYVTPHYTAVLPDGTLENNLGSWDTIAECALRHTIPPRTAFGAPTSLNHLPRFPASTNLPTVSKVGCVLACALSSNHIKADCLKVGSALACVIPWDDPGAVLEAQDLLGEDRVLARELIMDFRKESLVNFRTTFKAQKKAEMECFGDKSFWKSGEGHDVVMTDGLAEDDDTGGGGGGGNGAA